MDLVSRMKGILLSPAKEWAIIDTEPTTVSSLYTGYIIPLAAIGPICGFIGLSVLGYNVLGVAIKIPMSTGLTAAIIGYGLALLSVYILALIIDALAPSFGGQKSQMQALKVSAYSATAAWVAGVGRLMPALGIIGILGLYSLYLLYVGLPVLMKSPKEKALGYTVVVIICMIVLYVLMGALVVMMVPGMGMGGLR